MSIIKSKEKNRCCICGTPTNIIEINYEAPFCSEICIRKMDVMSACPKLLRLPIKKKWFGMCLSGEKKQEYREIKDYYTTRFSNILKISSDFLKSADRNWKSRPIYIEFVNGYAANSPSFIAECRLCVDIGKKEWGAEKGSKYYVLEIDRILWKSIDGMSGYLLSEEL